MGRFIDLTGKIFCRLTVIKRADDYISPNGHKITMWLCKCECGNYTMASKPTLDSGRKKSCGCLKNSYKQNLKNKQFGNLTVIKFDEEMSNKLKISCWECECLCGGYTSVRATSLLNGETVSCGCLGSRNQSMSQSIKDSYVDGTMLSKLEPKISSANTSGCVGVTYVKSRNKYRSRITFKGKVYSLGYYHSIEDAKQARKEAENELFGEFLAWYKENYKDGKRI